MGNRHIYAVSAAGAGWRHHVLILLAMVLPLLGPGRVAAAEPPTSADAAPTAEATLVVLHRPVFVFRGSLLGMSPSLRAKRAKGRIDELLAEDRPHRVKLHPIPEGYSLQIDGVMAFTITPADADLLIQETPQQTAEKAVHALQTVIDESREGRNLHALGRAAGHALLASLALVVVLKLAAWVWRHLEARLGTLAHAHAERLRIDGAQILSGESAYAVIRRLLQVAYWALSLLLVYLWIGFVLSRFPYTRVWGERLNHYLADIGGDLLEAVVATLPDLFVALVIFLIARFATAVVGNFFAKVASGRVKLASLDRDLAIPTRRIASVSIWLFALAMAYPYLPGSHTEAFRGLSVLIGLMLSLGASTHIGQAVSGLILTYTRTFRPGEYVRIADHEGTVVELGLVATRIRTGMGEELTLPNSLILGNVTKNYSRAVEGRGFILDATVTIGYDTPWRQVEALLLAAARRTPGILAAPPPQVFQTALSDFYPEYRLVCQAIPAAPRPRAEVLTALHANIQDVFNEYGVQIMSPHYLGDPAHAKVVPPEDWHRAPASPAPR